MCPRMYSIIRFSTLFLASVAECDAQIPEAMHGIWAGNITASPLGTSGLSPNFLIVSQPDKAGNTYMRHPYEAQLMRVQGSLMQYCFNYDDPQAAVTGADEAPFKVVPGSHVNEVKFCWRGRRLPSHKASCSGCDCAQWILEVDGNTIKSRFMMSPPAVHLSIDLVRTGSAPQPDSVRSGWDCRFDNHTGFPNRTAYYTETTYAHPRVKFPSCPHLHSIHAEQQHPILPAAEGNADGQVHNCVILGNPHMKSAYRIKFEYLTSALPCWPCDVAFKFSMNDPAPNEYFAIGFKELYAAYKDWDVVSNTPEYWGMMTSKANLTELGGRIIVGYMDETGNGCVRRMRADAYVGSVVDAEDDGLIRNLTLVRANGRMTIQFTALIHLGRNATDISWYHDGGVGKQRVMWATGSVGGHGGCSAQLGYHAGNRMVASLHFPGFGSPCTGDDVETELAAFTAGRHAQKMLVV